MKGFILETNKNNNPDDRPFLGEVAYRLILNVTLGVLDASRKSLEVERIFCNWWPFSFPRPTHCK